VKRLALAALVLIALAACSAQEQRPEGIVERWLVALNQGSAGQPGRYAPVAVSEEVLPGWEKLDPGEFDVIEVGRSNAIGGTCVEGQIVPFRVVPIEGHELRDAACVVGSRIAQLTSIRGISGPVFPSEGGPAMTEDLSAPWLIAAGIGLLVLLVAEGLMRLVRPRESG
jgi:hypothetical protein